MGLVRLGQSTWAPVSEPLFQIRQESRSSPNDVDETHWSRLTNLERCCHTS